jgi:hypothetical protein
VKEKPYSQIVLKKCEDPNTFHKYKQDGRDMLGTSVLKSKAYIREV